MNRSQWRRELVERRREAQAKAIFKMANRTWKQHPSRLDALISRLIAKVAASRSPSPSAGDDDDLYL